jgi:hypothetical protein
MHLKKIHDVVFDQVLLAVVGARAAPQLLAYPYYAHAVLPAASVVATGGSVPVAIGGYKAVAGEGGAVHEVPGLLPAPALAKQESAGGVSLSTGTPKIHFPTFVKISLF